MLLRAAIADGVEYVDLEADIADDIPRYGKTKRIVSLHNFRETPENLEEIHARLASLDADIVKIATMANDPHDNVRMLQLVRQSKIPTVGICMGEIGTPSRILAGKFGAPFTYSTFATSGPWHRAAEFSPDEGYLPLRPHQGRDQGVWRDCRSGRSASRSGGPQCRLSVAELQRCVRAVSRAAGASVELYARL